MGLRALVNSTERSSAARAAMLLQHTSNVDRVMHDRRDMIANDTQL